MKSIIRLKTLIEIEEENLYAIKILNAGVDFFFFFLQNNCFIP